MLNLAAPLAAALLLTTPAQREPFPDGDGFIYPGEPGSEGMEDYYKRWARHLSKLPPAGEGRPAALESFAWMQGKWQATLREYESDMDKGRGIVETGRGTAIISFTPDQRWLRIESDLPKRFNAKYIGYDRAAKQLVMQEVTSPGITYLAALNANSWTRERISFGPVDLLFYGLQLNDRITIVRNGLDQFRVVVEGRLPSGKYMAADDILYTRVPAPKPSQ